VSRATPTGEALTALVLRVFRLNGLFLQIAEEIAQPVGLTAAWWQVLGAVLGAPLPVAAIAREMGLTRQAVQRIADLLVEHGLASYAPNPAHKRAKLLCISARGRRSIAALAATQHAWSDRLGRTVGARALTQTNEVLDRVLAALQVTPASASTEES
jgi:DNA-binding MarR family transcriptional regulator